MDMTFRGTDTLGEAAEKLDKTLPWLERFDQNMPRYFSAIKATTFNLREPVEDWSALSETIWSSGAEVVESLRAREDLIGLLVNATCRLSLANWYGDPRRALQYAEEGDRYVGAGPGLYLIPVFQFHQCLAYAACDRAEGDARAAYVQKIESALPRFERWAKRSSPTYLHRFLLIRAELARANGTALEAIDSYSQAIRSANASGFLEDEALACERCASFWLSCGNEKIGRLYLAEAYYAYERWGAGGKLRQLETTHPQMLASTGASAGGLEAHMTFATQAATSLENAQLYDEMKEEVARRKHAEEREHALLEVTNAIMSNLTQDNLPRHLSGAAPGGAVRPFRHLLARSEQGHTEADCLESSVPSVHFAAGYEISIDEGNAGWAGSSWPTVARFSSTKSANCLWRLRSNCSACCRNRNSSPSAAAGACESMCASSLPRTGTWKRRWSRGNCPICVPRHSRMVVCPSSTS